MDHSKQAEVETLLQAGIPVLLVGKSGSGKSTIIQKAAKNAGRPYSFIAGTRQTTVGNILGFLSVNGTYVKSTFRTAYEEGHIFSIEEISAMDSNCLLVFNSLENGIMPFPDNYSEPPHKDFRLCATDNPHDAHSSYTGRSKLDAASMDRFDIIDVERDSILEQSLVDFSTYANIKLARTCLEESNSSTVISMRDTIRYQKRKDLNLLDGFVERLLVRDLLALEKYTHLKGNIPRIGDIEECKTLKEMWEYVSVNANKVLATPVTEAPNYPTL